MRDEAPALARLTLEGLGAGAGGIGTIHLAIADRAFGAGGPGAAPARAIHDAITTGVYAAVRGGAGLLGMGAEAALKARGGGPAPPLVVGVVNGLIGDRLEAEGNPLAAPMAVRVGGFPVELERTALREAFPQATTRIVVFVHGLMETERAWRLGGRPTYGERLLAEVGATPVDIRFNSGRHISENGRALAGLLSELEAEWPVAVAEVALVGHSMGGLVARSACHVGTTEGHAWVGKVRHVVSLGTPHMGAPLAQALHHASHALHRLPETRALGNLLRRRSAGIRDLRHGSLVDEDWRDRDPDDLKAVACREVPLLAGATHCFVSATVTRSPRHPLGRLVGDYLVLAPSASGRSRSRRIPFDADYGHHVGGASHIALLNHPDVYERLRGWLAARPASGRGSRRASSRSAGR